MQIKRDMGGLGAVQVFLAKAALWLYMAVHFGEVIYWVIHGSKREPSSQKSQSYPCLRPMLVVD